MHEVLTDLCAVLRQGAKGLVMARIIASCGSTPRSAGTAMLIHSDGSITGTIGGGLIEEITRKQAEEISRQGRPVARFVHHYLDNELAAQADMICGGQVTILLEYLSATPEQHLPFARVQEALSQGKQAVLLTRYKETDAPSSASFLPDNTGISSGTAPDADTQYTGYAIPAGHAVFPVSDPTAFVLWEMPQQKIPGQKIPKQERLWQDCPPDIPDIPDTPDTLSKLSQACSKALQTEIPVIVETPNTPNTPDTPNTPKTPKTLSLITPFSPQPALYLFGAGHVAQSTAHLAHTVGFRTVILDDRKEFANSKRFPAADAIQVPASMHTAFEGLTVRPGDALVIVTRGHLHDKIVLQQALTSPAGFIGMIGSRRKRDAIYKALRQEGISEQAIARCHCPIGLPINAASPEEIAVSIVAQLIQYRAQDR